MHGLTRYSRRTLPKGILAIASREEAALELQRQRLLDIRWARRRSMLLFARRTAFQAALVAAALYGHLPIDGLLRSLL